MNEQPKIMEIGGEQLAVTFIREWTLIDPRRANRPMPNQDTTICIIRPLSKGPKETFGGVTVANPKDYDCVRTGKIVALARALVAGAYCADERIGKRFARRWFWEQDQAEKVPAVEIPVEA